MHSQAGRMGVRHFSDPSRWLCLTCWWSVGSFVHLWGVFKTPADDSRGWYYSIYWIYQNTLGESLLTTKPRMLVSCDSAARSWGENMLMSEGFNMAKVCWTISWKEQLWLQRCLPCQKAKLAENKVLQWTGLGEEDDGSVRTVTGPAVQTVPLCCLSARCWQHVRDLLHAWKQLRFLKWTALSLPILGEEHPSIHNQLFGLQDVWNAKLQGFQVASSEISVGHGWWPQASGWRSSGRQGLRDLWCFQDLCLEMT